MRSVLHMRLPLVLKQRLVEIYHLYLLLLLLVSIGHRGLCVLYHVHRRGGLAIMREERISENLRFFCIEIG